MPTSQPDKLIRVREVAEITGLDEKTIYGGGCETNRILRIKVSRRCTLFSYQSVNEFVEWLKAKAIAEAKEREGNARGSARIILLRKPQLRKNTIDRILRTPRSQRRS